MTKFYIHKKEKGQGLAEYALILGLVSIVCIAGLTLWGQHVNNSVRIINNALNTVNTNISTTT